MKQQIACFVTLQEPQILKGQAVIPALGQIGDYTTAVIDLFARFFRE